MILVNTQDKGWCGSGHGAGFGWRQVCRGDGLGFGSGEGGLSPLNNHHGRPYNGRRHDLGPVAWYSGAGYGAGARPGVPRSDAGTSRVVEVG